MEEEKKKGFFAEFREFATRGNVLDMAVGVILATAFTKITTSLVNDVFLPLIAYVFGANDFSQLNIVLRPAVMDGETVIEEALTIGIGTFVATIVDFLLVALVIFLMVKGINRAHEKLEARRKKDEAEEEEEVVEPSPEELLLTEIRDLLRENAHGK